MYVSNYTRFNFNINQIEEYKAFLDRFGFIHFKNFVSQKDVSDILDALKEIEQTWVSNQRKSILGIPIIYGKDLNGQTIVQRFPFTSLCHTYFNSFYIRRKLCLVRKMLGNSFRIGKNENDGVVSNHYVNHSSKHNTMNKMGWHTDSLREVFYLRKIHPFYNVGIHLDDCHVEQGGLRVLPATHKQSLFNMFFRKPYFIHNKADKKELCIEVNAGDLTIHNGKIWHRVAQSHVEGEKSRRRVIYFPFIRGSYNLKSEDSKTPLYMKVLYKLRNIVN